MVGIWFAMLAAEAHVQTRAAAGTVAGGLAPRDASHGRPSVGPVLKWLKSGHQRTALLGQPVPARVVIDDAELSELFEPGVERARIGFANVLKGAERQGITTQFPQHAQRPPPAEHVERHHDRPA